MLDVDFRLQRPGGFSLDACFSAPGQGVTALFGGSGSGKTTLLRCVAGLEEASGRCRIQDQVWQDGSRFLPTHRRPVGYVFQEASLFPHLSVRANLDFGRRLVPVTQQRIHFDEVVELLGIGPLLKRASARLSGGERQRVALARAVVMGPRLLLADEPTGNLDRRSAVEVMGLLERMNAEGLTLIVVTHDMAVAERARRIVRMDDGALVEAA